MLAGKRFRFYKATIGIESIEGKRIAVTIPAGEKIRVIGEPRNDERKVDIIWSRRIISVFAVDLEGHGAEMPEE